MLSSLKKIVNFAKSQGVKVAIETEGSFRKKNLSLMQKPNEYKELFKYFKPNDLGVNLNIGHLNLASRAFKFSKFEFVSLQNLIAFFACSILIVLIFLFNEAMLTTKFFFGIGK